MALFGHHRASAGNYRERTTDQKVGSSNLSECTTKLLVRRYFYWTG
jgi:hypothetical protein